MTEIIYKTEQQHKTTRHKSTNFDLISDEFFIWAGNLKMKSSQEYGETIHVTMMLI